MVSVGRVGRRIGKDFARLPPGCRLMTTVVRAMLPGSGGSTALVSAECSGDAAGGADGAQMLGRGPPSSLIFWHLESLSLVSGV